MIELDTALSTPEARAAAALVAVAMLVAGRQLFWLAVATLGFLGGLWVGAELFAARPLAWSLLAGVVAGAVGAVVAVVLQKIAVAVAGFALGVVAARQLLALTAVELGQWELLAILLAGALASLAALALLSVALAVLTAGAGAALLSEALLLPEQARSLLFIALWIVGAALQLRSSQRQR